MSENAQAQIEALHQEVGRLRGVLKSVAINSCSSEHLLCWCAERWRETHSYGEHSPRCEAARAALSTSAEPVKPRVKKLPDVMPGHWETAEGHEKALEYFSKNRGDLAMGDVPDLALANAVYLIDRSDTRLVEFQGAAKERIRWLSAQLAARLSSNIEDAG